MKKGTLMAVISTATAVKIDSTFRPPPNNSAEPWHKGPKWPEWTDP